MSSTSQKIVQVLESLPTVREVFPMSQDSTYWKVGKVALLILTGLITLPLLAALYDLMGKLILWVSAADTVQTFQLTPMETAVERPAATIAPPPPPPVVVAPIPPTPPPTVTTTHRVSLTRLFCYSAAVALSGLLYYHVVQWQR